MFTELLARFRALSLYYQECHWSVQGPLFYSDHLLFERLYNDVNDAIDAIAEKGIGVTGSLVHVVLQEHLTRVAELVKDCPAEADANAVYFAYALRMEHELYDFLVSANKAEEHIGVQNLLQDLADQGTQRQYLVRQRADDYPDDDGDDDSSPASDKESVLFLSSLD